MKRHPDFDRYVSACDYPGVIDEAKIESSLRTYLSALGIGARQVVRIRAGWALDERHVVEGHVDVYGGKALPPGFTLPKGATEKDMLGPVVVVRSGAVLTHPEHAHHALECAVDQVTYQWDETTRARQRD